MANWESVKDRLKRRHIGVSEEWVSACLDWLNDEHEGEQLSENRMNELVYQQWLLSDLQELESSCLPVNIRNKEQTITLSIPCTLQVNYAADISQSYFSQLIKLEGMKHDNSTVTAEDDSSTKPWEPKASRTLCLSLTDGSVTVKGMEYQSIPAFREGIKPGAKLLVKPGVKCRNGTLLLTSAKVQLLGGEVEHLVGTNSQEHILRTLMEAPNTSGRCQKKTFPNAGTVSSLVIDGTDRKPKTESIANIHSSQRSHIHSATAQHKDVSHNLTATGCKISSSSSSIERPPTQSHEPQRPSTHQPQRSSAQQPQRPGQLKAEPQSQIHFSDDDYIIDDDLDEDDLLMISHGEESVSENRSSYAAGNVCADRSLHDRPISVQPVRPIISKPGRGCATAVSLSATSSSRGRYQMDSTVSEVDGSVPPKRSRPPAQRSIEVGTTDGVGGMKGKNRLESDVGSMKGKSRLESDDDLVMDLDEWDNEESVHHPTPSTSTDGCKVKSSRSDVTSAGNRSDVTSAVSRSIRNSRGDCVDLQSQPYTYISVVKKARPSESDRLGLKITLKAYVSTLLSKIDSGGGQAWSIKGRINDGSGYLDVTFSHKVLVKIIGLAPWEIMEMKKKAHTCPQTKHRLLQCMSQGQLNMSQISCLMRIEFTDRGPVVIDTAKVSLLTLQNMKKRLF